MTARNKDESGPGVSMAGHHHVLIQSTPSDSRVFESSAPKDRKRTPGLSLQFIRILWRVFSSTAPYIFHPAREADHLVERAARDTCFSLRRQVHTKKLRTHQANFQCSVAIGAAFHVVQSLLIREMSGIAQRASFAAVMPNCHEKSKAP